MIFEVLKDSHRYIKMEMIVERDDDGLRMVYNGAFNAANSVTIEQLLSASMRRAGHETLVLTNVTTIDITGIKLAYAWKRALELQNRSAKVLLPECSVVKDLLSRTGITKLF
jgi:hypothetical protein